MNRYSGNSGIVERIPEHAVSAAPSAPVYSTDEAPVHREPRGGGSANPLGFLFGKKPPEQSMFGSLGGLLSKFSKESLEIEDYIMLGVLYLLYRESGDIEFLLIAGAMFIL
jgi:hypothetical protein